jgi:hypothetical protein
MIRNGLWERERKAKMIKEGKEWTAMKGDSGGAVKSYLGFKLHRRRSPPHCNLLSIVTNQSIIASNRPATVRLTACEAPDSLSNVYFG